MFFYSTWFNPGVYLAVLFYQPGKKIAQLFGQVGKEMARYTPGQNKKHDRYDVENWLIDRVKYVIVSTGRLCSTLPSCQSAIRLGKFGDMVHRFALLVSFPHLVVDSFQVGRVHSDVKQLAVHTQSPNLRPHSL